MSRVLFFVFSNWLIFINGRAKPKVKAERPKYLKEGRKPTTQKTTRLLKRAYGPTKLPGQTEPKHALEEDPMLDTWKHLNHKSKRVSTAST